MVKQINVNSYFNMFDVLLGELKETNLIEGKRNVIFCEEKISLMTERIICSKFKGSFNTDVYSFGNFLRAKIKREKVLSKEGSSMAIRKILAGLNLISLRTNKRNVAPSLFELFIQLKSASVSSKDLGEAIGFTDGILKRKLVDICAVYKAYEEFIEKEGYLDQSSFLSLLPDVLTKEEFKNTNVYILGFTNGFTKQLKNAVTSLLKNAYSVTGIFVKGDNPFVYLNETADSFTRLCRENKIDCSSVSVEGDFNEEGKIFIKGLFNPLFKSEKFETDKIKILSAKNKHEEVLRIAETIKRKVIEGARHRDFSVGNSLIEDYADEFENVFSLLDIPYFLDKKKRAESHPLISLIVSYCDVFRTNFKREYLSELVKNPLISDDKEFSGRFIDYLVKYGIEYSKIKEPFVFEKNNTEFNEFEKFRKELVSYFDKFSVRGLIKKIDAEEKLKVLSERLKSLGYNDDAAANDQTFDAVMKILGEMDLLLESSDIVEYKKVFLSGVSALELSVIPQYSDAVFIGDFKETALVKTKFLFLSGLNSSVPSIKEDVALLTDADLDRLENISLKIEPKIRVVNDRNKEQVAMACASFSDELYLSYSITNDDGSENEKSEILNFASKNFKTYDFLKIDGYLTEKEGLRSFALDCGRFYNKKILNFINASSFREATDYNKTDLILSRANKTLAKRVENANCLYGEETSPTAIESFYRCPYKAFLEHGIKLKEKEIGEVDSRVVGIVMHEVFKTYAENINKVCDRETSNSIVYKVKESLLEREEILKYKNTARGEYMIESLFNECANFCYKTYLSLKRSEFSPDKTEIAFGKGKDLPPIELCGGKFNLKGKIDRVDTFGDYYRIIDYKSGSADSDDKELFSGKKLQLYLYAAAIKGKQLAGAYYYKTQENFKDVGKEESIFAGKTLNSEDAIKAQDKEFFDKGESDVLPITLKDGKIKDATDKETLDAYIEYAIKVCEKGAEEMTSGVIVASPLEKTCSYCEFNAVCENYGEVRSINGVNEQTIIDAVKGEEDDRN